MEKRKQTDRPREKKKKDERGERFQRKEIEAKGEKQEKQRRASLFRGGCCGINSVKSRRAVRVSETAREIVLAEGRVAGREKEEQEREREKEKREQEQGMTEKERS